jgi:hypothetical protein
MVKHFENFFLNKSFLFIIAAFMLLNFWGCKKEKGCTDKNALNYNNVAEENDGSCVYCNLELKQIANRTVYLVDDNWSSQYYNQEVAKFDLTQITKKYNDQKCGSDECAVAVSVKSLVDKQMEFTYYISISNFAGSPSTYLLINPYQTMPQDSIVLNNSFTTCESIGGSSITVYLNSGYIIYH